MKINPEGWMQWAGQGVCPVNPEYIVQTKYRNLTDTAPARDINWNYCFAYRVVGLGDGTLTPFGKSLAEFDEIKAAQAKVADVFRAELDKPKASKTQAGGDHYVKMGVQPWDVVDTWPKEQQIGYHRGNLLKYIMRLGVKDDVVTSAEKIAHYAQKLVEVVKK